MNKKLLAMQLSAGFAAAFLAVAPVYAETNPTMSQPVSASKKGSVILPKAEPSGNISVPAERDNANANPAAELKNAPTSLTVGLPMWGRLSPRLR